MPERKSGARMNLNLLTSSAKEVYLNLDKVRQPSPIMSSV